MKLGLINQKHLVSIKLVLCVFVLHPGSQLDKVYFSHPHNPSTRIRVQILWAIAKALRKSKTEAWVSQGSTRPSLMIKTEKAPRILSYIQAIKEYGFLVEESELTHAKEVANRFFKGELEAIFVILSDSPNTQGEGEPTSATGQAATTSGTGSASTSTSGTPGRSLVNFRTPIRSQKQGEASTEW